MDAEESNVEERAVRVPLLGTKVTWLVGGLFLVAALYFALVPLTTSVKGGGSWGCGSAPSGPSDSFGAGLCGSINTVFIWRAGALALAGVLVAGGGTALFGMGEKVVQRAKRPVEEV